MTSLITSWRKLFRKGEHSLTRIISLSAGLAFGILLLSEVFYFYSFDSFYPDADRIYVVSENYKSDGKSDKITSRPRVSGAIAPGLKAEVPGIVAASRLNSIGPSVFYTDDKKSYKGEFSFTDENLFDVLPRPVVVGNPREILKSPGQCMISDKLAGMIGGNVVGKTIELKEYPGKILTIAGIFKELPENTNYKYDVLISMVSTSTFMWDGSDNWLGNDRYYVCVKLAPGVDPESLAPAVRKMQEVHQDIVRIESIQEGMTLKYSFSPITKVHAQDLKTMIVFLCAIAFAVLLVSLLNYTLLTLNALVSRARTAAIFKTYGAQIRDIQMMIFGETSVIYLVSLVAAFLIISIIQPFIEVQLGHKLSSVLNPVVLCPLGIILLLLLVVISYLPGRFFGRIPVSSVFQSYHQKGKKWKLALLALQFTGATFVLTVLIIVILQYDKFIKSDHGYRVKNIYYTSTSGMPGNRLSGVLNELRAVPQIEKVGLGSTLPIEGPSGNNVQLPDSEKELFNVADYYWIDDNFLSILNIPVTTGTGFSSENCTPNDYLVSQKCADMIIINSGWKDGVIGKQINLTEHGTFTIRGVFPDFVSNSISTPDRRPIMFSYLPESKFQERIEKNPSFSCFIIVKAHEGTNAGIQKRISDIMNKALPHQDAVIKSLENEQIALYSSEEEFRTIMIVGNIIILLITLLGLLGYTATEVSRRSKEMAIRKINGAKLTDVLRIFIRDLELTGIPAVIVGLTAAWFGAQKWMENFIYKAPLHWGLFMLCGMFILFFIAFVSIFQYRMLAAKNPVETLKYE